MLSSVTRDSLAKKFGSADAKETHEESEYLEVPEPYVPMVAAQDDEGLHNIPEPDKLDYKYDISSALQGVKTVRDTTVSLCVYRVNESGKDPFVEYLMYRYPKKHDSLIIFPVCSCAARTVAKSVAQFKKDNFADQSVPIRIHGHIRHQNTPFVFAELPTVSDAAPMEDKQDAQLIWVVVSEIVNYKHVYGDPIHSSATTLFLDNPVFCALSTRTDHAIDAPDIFYVGDKSQKILYESVFGLAKSTPYASLGPFYYLGTYENATDYAKGDRVFRSKGQSKSPRAASPGKSGILRFVIFSGRTKVMRNKPRRIASSDRGMHWDAEHERYADSVRYMRDNAGMWAGEYDSVIAGRVPLKGGKLYKENPIIAVRAWNQQLPMSWRIFK